MFIVQTQNYKIKKKKKVNFDLLIENHEKEIDDGCCKGNSK